MGFFSNYNTSNTKFYLKLNYGAPSAGRLGLYNTFVKETIFLSMAR